ncbi:MAG: hypothetical protein KDB22_18070 [Planctomycetales bacterium]|nr:hypothetical protein [Planctomycetales bacterium]
MNENKLKELLQANVPPAPQIDRAALVRRLATAGRSNREVQIVRLTGRIQRIKIATATILGASAFAASIGICIGLLRTYEPQRTSTPYARTESVQTQSFVQNEAAESIAHESLASEVHLQQLEDELRFGLASLQNPDTSAQWATEIRASESLWMLVDVSQVDTSPAAKSILALYPQTPAAKRCKSLFVSP